MTATSTSLSWTSAGSEDVSYEVMWETDDIGGCSGGSDMSSTTITDDSTSYYIMGLEEDSCYIITVKTINLTDYSEVRDSVTTKTLTLETRENCIFIVQMLCFSYLYFQLHLPLLLM